MIKSNKIISIYEPNDIYKVIEELNKGARELGKLTLEEQTERMYDKEFWEKHGWVSCFECDIIFEDLKKLYEHQEIHVKKEQKNNYL